MIYKFLGKRKSKRKPLILIARIIPHLILHFWHFDCFSVFHFKADSLCQLSIFNRSILNICIYFGSWFQFCSLKLRFAIYYSEMLSICPIYSPFCSESPIFWGEKLWDCLDSECKSFYDIFETLWTKILVCSSCLPLISFMSHTILTLGFGFRNLCLRTLSQLISEWVLRNLITLGSVS